MEWELLSQTQEASSIADVINNCSKVQADSLTSYFIANLLETDASNKG